VIRGRPGLTRIFRAGPFDLEAVVSSSVNCVDVLVAAGIDDFFEARGPDACGVVRTIVRLSGPD